MTIEKTNKLQIIECNNGYTILLNDYRIAGDKPWGGGTVVKTYKVSEKDIVEALENKK